MGVSVVVLERLVDTDTEKEARAKSYVPMVL